MNKHWMPDVIRDLKKCAENRNFSILAKKLDEAYWISKALDGPYAHFNDGRAKPKTGRADANIINISDHQK